MDKQLEIPVDIKLFLESLIEDAGLMNNTDLMKETVLQELYERFDKYMLSKIVESLPQEKLEEFTKMAEENKNMEELNSYLKANIPDAEAIFAQSMLDFRSLYLGEKIMEENNKVETQNPL
ncbi:hypothetical protein C4577_01275 [Candidatus Parcubacteria bacterium]|nr:MAG: hypothetical protein C4577_01275 [Candidatus Parcubacteria bacterium]